MVKNEKLLNDLKKKNQIENELIDDPSVFPLAIPLITGPGAIATVILIAGSKPGLVGLYQLGLHPH